MAEEADLSQLDFQLSADCEPLTTIAGCVNVESGHFFQVEHDLIGNTIDPIIFTRHFDSSSMQSSSIVGFGWGTHMPLFSTKPQKVKNALYGLISDREGFFIPYKTSLTKSLAEDLTSPPAVYHIDPKVLKKGYTNCNTLEEIGHSNIQNWHATFYKAGWIVELGDGTKRFYHQKHHVSHSEQKEMGLPVQTLYLLSQEIKPNGNKVLFEYQGSKLAKIKTVGRTEELLNQLSFYYFPGECVIDSSCGSQITYAYKTYPKILENPKRDVLQEVRSSQKGTTRYYSDNTPANPKITKVIKPNGQLMEVHYNYENQVQALIEPVGPKGEGAVTYSLQYQKGKTFVRDVHNQLKLYSFDKEQRLASIQYFENDTPIRQDSFQWSQNPDQKGWLQAKYVLLGDRISHATTFVYDKNGNAVRKTLFGNLTGTKSETMSRLEEGDQYSIDYVYSQNARNVLLSKTTPEGLTISYSYVPGTNLRSKEMHHYNGKIQERFFKFYDSNGEVHCTIEDDGSRHEFTDLTNVTYRRKKEIHSVKEKGPSFGKPSLIIESYLDLTEGHLVPLTRKEFTYDNKGCEIGQKVYEGQNFCYEIFKTYDSALRLTSETDAEGITTLYSYDERNNICRKEKIGSGKWTSYEYDPANRLRVVQEHHQDGEVFKTTYHYNGLNQIIAEEDHYGNHTFFAYDRFGHQVKKVSPKIELATDSCHPTTEKRFNALGQMLIQTDENGASTQYLYTVRGDPTKIIYPDHTQEQFFYNPSGWLKKKIQADGTTICYAHDPKGRVIKQTTYSLSGIYLKQEEYTYKGANLTCHKDAMGVETQYTYDCAGRKSEVKTLDKVTKYTYDGFGQILSTQKGDQLEINTYNGIGQIISKTLQDTNGQIYSATTYTYDINGHQIEKTVQQTKDSFATYKSQYDSHQSLVLTEDPLNNRTTWKYNYHHRDCFGQRVCSRTMTDALGRETYEEDDVLHRLVKKDILEDGKIVSSTHFYYDPKGNKTKQHTIVMDQGIPIREYGVQWSYNKNGLVEKETEYPEGKVTQYRYDSFGRRICKTKPDGIRLHYNYDALGRLNGFHSSDNSVCYSYTYDLHDNPTEIKDLVQDKTYFRDYDLLNRLLSDGPIHYQYDALDRITEVILPDNSSVTYTYEPFHLQSASRPSYSITCDSYDLRGNLLKLIAPGTTITTTYDLLSRPISIQTSDWESKLLQFDSVGNVLTLSEQGVDETFTYDRFNHITSEKDHAFNYDSLGNCLTHNTQTRQINHQNQLIDDGASLYIYDKNGNLISQTNPTITYQYDALNRLIRYEKEDAVTTLTYDPHNRCIQITQDGQTQDLIYQGNQEIGSLVDNQLQAFRLIHPYNDTSFALELQNVTYFPVQDSKNNICALYNQDGSLINWYHYSTFGTCITNNQTIQNPWTFANRRMLDDLSIFTHRIYNTKMMRWLSTDPIGFEDDMNLYTYVRNNPFKYTDPDGRFAILIPIFTYFFPVGVAAATATGTAAAATTAVVSYEAIFLTSIMTTAYALRFAAFATSMYYAGRYVDDKINEKLDGPYNSVKADEEGIEVKVDPKTKKPDVYAPDRPLPKTKNGVPIPESCDPHTQLGTKEGSTGKYVKAREFDYNGDVVRDIEFTDHGKPHNHANPHQHVSKPNPTGGTPNRGKPELVPEWDYI